MHHLSEQIIRNLHPVALQQFRKLTEDLERAHKDSYSNWCFRPFEGLRSPIKQEELFAKRPPVTHVGAWKSPHQYGLAVDFVPYNVARQAWSWEAPVDWTVLKTLAAANGLRNTISWDKPHVEHPFWDRVRGLMTI